MNIENRDGIDAGEGLIQEHKTRIGSQRPGDFDAASFAAGQADAETRAYMADMQLVEQLIEFLLTSCAVKFFAVFEYR